MAKKKSLLDQAMEQGGDVVAISTGYILAGVAANTVAARLDSDSDASSIKDLAVGIAVPAAAGAATRMGIANDMAQKAGLGMYVRAGVNGVAWTYAKLMSLAPSADDLSGSGKGHANSSVAATRAPRRLAPGNRQRQQQERDEQERMNRGSGLANPTRQRSYKRA